MHLLLEPLQRFADALSNLWEFAGAKDNEHDHENNDQL
jgi:hypothetical protein